MGFIRAICASTLFGVICTIPKISAPSMEPPKPVIPRSCSTPTTIPIHLRRDFSNEWKLINQTNEFLLSASKLGMNINDLSREELFLALDWLTETDPKESDELLATLIKKAQAKYPNVWGLKMTINTLAPLGKNTFQNHINDSNRSYLGDSTIPFYPIRNKTTRQNIKDLANSLNESPQEIIDFLEALLMCNSDEEVKITVCSWIGEDPNREVLAHANKLMSKLLYNNPILLARNNN